MDKQSYLYKMKGTNHLFSFLIILIFFAPVIGRADEKKAVLEALCIDGSFKTLEGLTCSYVRENWDSTEWHPIREATLLDDDACLKAQSKLCVGKMEPLSLSETERQSIFPALLSSDFSWYRLFKRRRKDYDPTSSRVLRMVLDNIPYYFPADLPRVREEPNWGIAESGSQYTRVSLTAIALTHLDKHPNMNIRLLRTATNRWISAWKNREIQELISGRATFGRLSVAHFAANMIYAESFDGSDIAKTVRDERQLLELNFSAENLTCLLKKGHAQIHILVNSWVKIPSELTGKLYIVPQQSPFLNGLPVEIILTEIGLRAAFAQPYRLIPFAEWPAGF